MSNFQNLLAELESGSAGKRFEAAAKLKYLTQKQPELIEQLLDYGSDSTVETAVWLVSQLKDPPHHLIPRLLPLLDSGSNSLVEKVVVALKCFDSEIARDSLEQYFLQEDIFS